MADIKALLNERGQLDKQIKDIVEKAETENRNLNAEETGTFDKLHAKDMELKTRVDRLQLLAKRDSEQSEIRNHGIDLENLGPSAAGNPPAEKRDAITAEERDMAIEAWGYQQMRVPLKKRHKAAVEKYRAQVDSRFSLSGDLRIDLAPTKQFQALQRDIASRHPMLQKRDGVTVVTGASQIPQGFVNRLETALLHFGPMLQTSEVLTTDSGNALPWPTANDTGNKGVQLDEATTIGSSVDPTLSSMTLVAYKFSSKLVKVSPEFIEDSAIDFVSWLGDALGERLGRILNEKFTTGSGTDTPYGIVPASTLGKTAALATAITADELIDLQHSVDIAYRAGAAWMLNDSTLKVIRKLKSNDNQYLLQSGFQLGVPDSMLGSAIFVNNDMAGIDDAGDTTDTGEKVVLYGQFNKYKARRVKGIRLRRLVERYADTDQEGFIAFVRADGDLLDAGTHPVKHLIMA